MTGLADVIYKKDAEKVRQLIKDKRNINQPNPNEWRGAGIFATDRAGSIHHA